jgi:hypothetical protein
MSRVFYAVRAEMLQAGQLEQVVSECLESETVKYGRESGGTRTRE